ncbi:Uncharacterized protein Fot_13685 [Forsythia ovata]|uniref:Uncharacterized protein n=1 Tax=Forsythia ovata TaxID=205694 RepID=A0ABD1W471_9LAMI
MDTPTRRMTRSTTKKESPDIVKKPPFHSKQKVIYLDTPTPTKSSIFEKNKNPHDEAGHRRMDDKLYTDDVMEQVEEIIKSAEKSKNSDTIEIWLEEYLANQWQISYFVFSTYLGFVALYVVNQ